MKARLLKRRTTYDNNAAWLEDKLKINPDMVARAIYIDRTDSQSNEVFACSVEPDNICEKSKIEYNQYDNINAKIIEEFYDSNQQLLGANYYDKHGILYKITKNCDNGAVVSKSCFNKVNGYEIYYPEQNATFRYDSTGNLYSFQTTKLELEKGRYESINNNGKISYKSDGSVDAECCDLNNGRYIVNMEIDGTINNVEVIKPSLKYMESLFPEFRNKFLKDSFLNNALCTKLIFKNIDCTRALLDMKKADKSPRFNSYEIFNEFICNGERIGFGTQTFMEFIKNKSAKELKEELISKNQ